MVFELGFGSSGEVRDGGRSVNDIGGRGSYGRADVPGIEGYSILKTKEVSGDGNVWISRKLTVSNV